MGTGLWKSLDPKGFEEVVFVERAVFHLDGGSRSQLLWDLGSGKVSASWFLELGAEFQVPSYLWRVPTYPWVLPPQSTHLGRRTVGLPG